MRRKSWGIDGGTVHCHRHNGGDDMWVYVVCEGMWEKYRGSVSTTEVQVQVYPTSKEDPVTWLNAAHRTFRA